MDQVETVARTPKSEQMEQMLEGKTPVKGTNPAWRPASQQGTLKAKSGFTARWVRNDPASVARKRQEGWIIMRPKDNAGTYENMGTVTDATPLTDSIIYQDQIAMMLPDDLKQARTEYHREQVRHATQSVLAESDREFKNRGVKTYTPKGQSGRIVIE